MPKSLNDFSVSKLSRTLSDYHLDDYTLANGTETDFQICASTGKKVCVINKYYDDQSHITWSNEQN